MRAKPASIGNARERLGSHEVGQPAGQVAFRLVLEAPPQQIGDDEAQNPVAEEFEALVAAERRFPPPATAVLGCKRARVGQSVFEELGLGEPITNNSLEIRGGQLLPLAALSLRHGTAGYSGSRTA